MIRCRVPVVAAVNGPAVGLGCSVIALSDVVYMAESAYLSDPHVTVGLVAADGGPLTWPLHTSLLLAKEYAFTGDRITGATGRGDRSRQPRVSRRRGARRRARGRAQDRRAPAAGGRGDEAGAEPAPRAGGARDDRLRDGVRDASRSTRPTSAPTSTTSSAVNRASGGVNSRWSAAAGRGGCTSARTRSGGRRRGPCSASEIRMSVMRSRMRSMLTRAFGAGERRARDTCGRRDRTRCAGARSARSTSELVGVLEAARVAVGGAVEHHHRRAGRDVDAADASSGRATAGSRP